MKNVLHTFGKKTLALVVIGFLATCLGLTTAQAAHANTGTTPTVTFKCPDGLSLVESSIVYEGYGPRDVLSAKYRKVTYTCSNSDGSITTKRSIKY